MNSNSTRNSLPALSAMVLTISASVYGAEPTTSSAATDAKAAGAITEPAQATSKSSIRFEGTDLIIGNLPPITFHGFASQGVIASDSYNYLGHSRDGSLEFNEFGLNASTSPFERTRISMQAFAFDVGNVGNYELMLDYGQIDYTFNNYLGVRGGRVRRPEGIYNHIQDVDLARTSVLLPQGLYDARWRDFSSSVDGGSLYGNAVLGKAGGLSYEVYAGMVNMSEEGGVASLLREGMPTPPVGAYGRVNGFPEYGGQLWWSTPIDGLRAGAALAYADGFSWDYSVFPPFGPGAIRTELNAVIQHYSLEYVWKSWTFQAEYKTENYISHSIAGGNSFNFDRSRNDKWYVSAAYRFNKWFEAGAYYTEYYDDVSNRDGSGNGTPSDAFQKDVALSLRFDPKPWWVLKLEGHAINGTALLDRNSLNPVRDDDEWFLVAAKTTFSF